VLSALGIAMAVKELTAFLKRPGTHRRRRRQHSPGQGGPRFGRTQNRVHAV
jgi:hypothetical protein